MERFSDKSEQRGSLFGQLGGVLFVVKSLTLCSVLVYFTREGCRLRRIMRRPKVPKHEIFAQHLS